MSARDSNFTQFEIQASEDKGKTVDIREGIASFSYYENILSNFITASVSVIESGTRTGQDRGGVTEGLLNYLPVRGGEEVRMKAKDSFGNVIDFSKYELYVNTVSVPNADATVSGHALKSDAAGNLSWGTAGGAAGGGTDDVFYENSQTVTTDYTISTNKNAMTAGPITINSGVTVTVPSGSSWVIV